MPGLESTLHCAGCGREIAAQERLPFRCPSAGAGDDVDHVLRRRLKVPDDVREHVAEAFASFEPNPFLRYRELLHSHRTATSWGMSDQDFAALVRELDARVAAVAGLGFRETPLVSHPGLAETLGCAEVWAKDETGNVGGTHKGRHLAGLLLWLMMEERLRDGGSGAEPRFAISSCGNAAFAATLLTRAVERPIDVYVPPDADPEVLGQFAAEGVGLRSCERRKGERGDPCYLRFSEAVADGSLPFTCQGPSNGLVIEGGQTLIWEVISRLLRERTGLDRLFVQTGGGALASACVLGWREAWQVREVGPMPALHAVQTEGAAPLVRAYDALAAGIAARRLGVEPALRPSLGERADLSARIFAGVDPGAVEEDLAYAAAHRSEFMWPWEEKPHSVADAILDDETYDWLPVVSGMLESGGYPVVVSEERLLEANELGRRSTGIDASVTGTAGLAGAREMADAGLLAPTERLALLFTGARSLGPVPGL